ncbi:MAG TPA: galactonate dehydratase [Chloroflexota bacterium]|nr:galactonate dehydratase [Chloroflexota bacterium]
MKITRVETLPATIGRRPFVYVKVHTDEGIIGIGEAACLDKERPLLAAIDDLHRYLVGADPFEIEKLWSLMYRQAFWRGGPVLCGALSGVEHALWDIKGKALGVPVYELLGGRYRHKVKVYTWIWTHGGAPEEYAEQALRLKEQGFRAAKFTPFEGCGPDFDLAHGKRVEAKVRAVREAVGDDFAIAVDGHGRLNPVNAVEMAKRVEPYGILFFEEPVLPEYPEAMAELRRVARIPVATGERLFTRYPFRDLLTRQAVDVVQPDVCTVGGIMETHKIASMAEAFMVSIAPHNPLSPLATVVCLHLDSVVPNFLIQEVQQGPGRETILTAQAEVVEDGYMRCPTSPGWGVELNEEFLRAHPFGDEKVFSTQYAEDGSMVDL